MFTIVETAELVTMNRVGHGENSRDKKGKMNTIKDIAAATGLTNSQVRRLCSRGVIPVECVQKIGGRDWIVIDLAVAIQAVKSRPKPGNPTIATLYKTRKKRAIKKRPIRKIKVE